MKLLVLLSFFFSVGLSAQTDTVQSHSLVDSCSCANGSYRFAEQMPVFPGGQAAFDQYLLSKTNNPQNVGSLVYIEFTVSKTGKVCNARVARGIAGMPQLDKRALRIIQESPPWTPGMMNGENVCVTMTVPVKMPPPKVSPR